MKVFISKVVVTLTVLPFTLSAVISTANAQQTTHAQASINAGSQASTQSAASAGHSIAATGQLTSGIIAVPLMSAGSALESVGRLSGQMANQFQQIASEPIGTPLILSEEIFTVIPPDQALKADTPSKNP